MTTTTTTILSKVFFFGRSLICWRCAKKIPSPPKMIDWNQHAYVQFKFTRLFGRLQRIQFRCWNVGAAYICDEKRTYKYISFDSEKHTDPWIRHDVHIVNPLFYLFIQPVQEYWKLLWLFDNSFLSWRFSRTFSKSYRVLLLWWLFELSAFNANVSDNEKENAKYSDYFNLKLQHFKHLKSLQCQLLHIVSIHWWLDYHSRKSIETALMNWFGIINNYRDQKKKNERKSEPIFQRFSFICLSICVFKM